MIHVIATIELKPDSRDAWLAEFHNVEPLVKAENGCIEYAAGFDIATGIAVQPPTREQTAIVVEKWNDIEALKTHLAAPHMATYRERVKELVTGVTLHVLRPA